MNEASESFRCHECGGRVDLRARPDLTREVLRGVHLPFPADVPVPSCDTCGEYYLDQELSEALDARLLPLVDE